MKKLIIVRHGEYSEDTEDLNDLGKKQMEAMGASLKVLLNGSSIQMLSSTAPRAEQSADVLSRILGTGFEKLDILWVGAGAPQRLPVLEEATNRIKASPADSVILMTHLEYSACLPSYFGKNVLGVRNFPYDETGKGQAWVIDCEAKTCTLLKPIL